MILSRLQKAKAMNCAALAGLTLALSLAVFAPFSLGQAGNAPPESPDSIHAAKATELYRVTGLVLDDVTNRPLPGAAVRLQFVVFFASCANCDAPLLAPPQPPPPMETVTGKDGRFVFNNVPARNISISAKKANYLDAWPLHRHASEPAGPSLIGKDVKPFVIRLAPAASISGAFRDHSGSPIRKNQFINLWRLGAWDGWPTLDYGGFATLNADGSYLFANLPPGHYYLAAAPPIDQSGPAHDSAGHAVGETPLRYPPASRTKPNPFFTLREGQHAHVDFQFPLKPLHRVTGVMDEDQNYSYSIEDADRVNTYLVTGSPFARKLEAWLPDGTFWLSTGRDDVSGTMPFEVAGSDVRNLQFSIRGGQIHIPVEVSIAPGDPASAAPEPPQGLWFLRMIRILPRGYVQVAGESTETGKMEGSPPHRLESVSVGPGDYTVEIAVWGNFYARSVVSGTTDLALTPLTVRREDEPAPIKVVLATAAKAEGVVRTNGRLARAWVYAVPLDIESKSDFRVFAPAASDNNGAFQMHPLAPGSYLFFACDTELPLNVHDPGELAYWLPRGKIVHLVAGETAGVLLTSVNHAPE